MKLRLRKRTTTNTVRDTVLSERRLKKAAKESIKDQKNLSKSAAKLRTHTATR